MSASTETAVAQHSLQHHFANMEQQRESTTLGMWIFLVTEIMFFGGLFAAYLIFRIAYPDVWDMGSQHMEFWPGTINTVILLCSSFTVAWSVHAVQLGHHEVDRGPVAAHRANGLRLPMREGLRVPQSL